MFRLTHVKVGLCAHIRIKYIALLHLTLSTGHIILNVSTHTHTCKFNLRMKLVENTA
jgi:hypothetical protein